MGQLLPVGPVLAGGAPPIVGVRLSDYNFTIRHSGAAGLALSLVSAFY